MLADNRNRGCQPLIYSMNNVLKVSCKPLGGLIKSSMLALLILWGATVSATFNINPELLLKLEKKHGPAVADRIKQWRELIENSKQLSDLEKLERVNDFFNLHIMFMDDVYLWKTKDYWATPMEFLLLGAGDCEDYSIAKYFTLLEMGVEDSKMRITYVKALSLNQAHMVLTYFTTPRAVPLVLDNLIPEISVATKRKDLLPVYSFNGSGLWLAKSRGQGKKVGHSRRLSLWNDLKQRMLKDILQ